MKLSLVVSAFLLATTAFADINAIDLENTIATIETREATFAEKARGTAGSGSGSHGINGGGGNGNTTGGNGGGNEEPPPTDPEYPPDRIGQTGAIIQVAKDVVSLGEAIYELVTKGKPKNQTEYAPISVVPREPGTTDYVDPFELEGFSMPVEKVYVTSIKGMTGKEMVRFEYAVMYAYGGSWNGAGKYLTGVIITPKHVKTLFGYDFSAWMKLSGLMNHGTKADPVAGAMLTIKYQINNMVSALEKNDTIHITGRGEIRNYSK